MKHIRYSAVQLVVALVLLFLTMPFVHDLAHGTLIEALLVTLVMVFAVLSDAVGFGVVLVPPVQWLVDAVTAGVLFAVLGFRWTLLSALAIEVVPGLQLFPAWTLVVGLWQARKLKNNLTARAWLSRTPHQFKSNYHIGEYYESHHRRRSGGRRVLCGAFAPAG